MPAQRIQRLVKGDKVTGDQPCSLMNELVKRMLPVGSWFTPVNRSGCVICRPSIERNVLPVAFHGQLLEISREALEILLVRQDRDRLGTKEVVIPKAH